MHSLPRNMMPADWSMIRACTYACILVRANFFPFSAGIIAGRSDDLRNAYRIAVVPYPCCVRIQHTYSHVLLFRAASVRSTRSAATTLLSNQPHSSCRVGGKQQRFMTAWKVRLVAQPCMVALRLRIITCTTLYSFFWCYDMTGMRRAPDNRPKMHRVFN